MVVHQVTQVDNVDGKICCGHKVWEPITNFIKMTGHPTGFRPSCIKYGNLVSKKFCVTCLADPTITKNTYAVHGFDNCKNHGGGKKCNFIDEKTNLQCDSPARPPFEKCVKHGGKRFCQEVLENDEICNGTIHDGHTVCISHGGFNNCENIINGKVCGKKRRGSLPNCADCFVSKICLCGTIHRSIGDLCYNCKYDGNIDGTLKKIYNQCLYNDETTNSGKSRDRLGKPFDFEFVKTLFLKQSGNCHWCNVELTTGKSTLDKISIDRIDSNLAHINENVVISCFLCNFSKGCMIDSDWKDLLNIIKGIKHKWDLSEYNSKAVTSTLSNIRGLNSKNLEKTTEKTVDVEWLYNRLQLQDFKCAITQLPFYYIDKKYFPLAPSIDRINSGLHTKDNCQLVCRFVNLGKNSFSDDDFLTAYIKRGFLLGDQLDLKVILNEKYSISKQTNKPVFSIDLNGKVDGYKSMADASRRLLMNAGNISDVIDNSVRSIRNKYWFSVDPRLVLPDKWKFIDGKYLNFNKTSVANFFDSIEKKVSYNYDKTYSLYCSFCQNINQTPSKQTYFSILLTKINLKAVPATKYKIKTIIFRNE